MTDDRKSPEQLREALRQLAEPVSRDVQARHVRDETAALRGLAWPTVAFPLGYLVLTLLFSRAGVDLRMPWALLLALTAVLPTRRVLQRREAARALRVREVEESLKIVWQALRQLPEGPVMARVVAHKIDKGRTGPARVMKIRRRVAEEQMLPTILRRAPGKSRSNGAISSRTCRCRRCP